MDGAGDLAFMTAGRRRCAGGGAQYVWIREEIWLLVDLATEFEAIIKPGSLSIEFTLS